MKAESVILLRSMRTTSTTTTESNFGNERVIHLFRRFSTIVNSLFHRLLLNVNDKN